MAGFLDQLDSQIIEVLSGWNVYSTVLAVGIVIYLIWLIVESQQDADTHPLLLARQAQASPVRLPGESSIFRSPEVPHGYPLRTGLQVRLPGMPAYAAGKDGDLRHIWRRVTGEIPLENGETSAPTQQGKILTILGKAQVVDHSIEDLTREIAIIGKSLRAGGAKRVAVYLPNSVELLLVIFAGAFYGFTPVLIPYNQPHARLINLLQKAGVDKVIAAAGSLPLAEVSNAVSTLRSIIWIVEKTSRHMEWNEVPEGIGGKVDVSVWHDLVQDEAKRGPVDLPLDLTPGNIIFLWQETPGADAELMEFTQINMVSAVAALATALPSNQRFSRSDLLLSAESLTHCYALSLTLVALWSQATVAINSVSGTGVEVGLSAQSIAPTIIVASAETAAKLHSNTSLSVTTGSKKLAHYIQGQALDAGRMPVDSFITSLNAPTRASIGTSPGKLRLLFISEKAGMNNPPITSNDLSDLRVFTGARVLYALTVPNVAGAVAQTHIYDYRRGEGQKKSHSHFGIPLSSVEVKLRDTTSHKTTDDENKGEIIVMGPAVVGGEVSLGILGTFRDDHTLAYL